MTDKIQDDDATLKKEYPRDFGEKLKAKREQMSISVSDAASRLHLSPRFIHLLENEDLAQSTLPAIYLRGYLRSYTRLLSIPETELNPILEKLNPTPAMDPEPVTVAATESLSIPFPLESNSYYARIATLVITLGLLTSITAWWYLHANDTPSRTVAALEQPISEAVSSSNPNPLNVSNPPSPLQTATPNAVTDQSPLPTTDLHLAEKNKTVALATNEPKQDLPAASKPVVKQDNDDEELVDEQE